MGDEFEQRIATMKADLEKLMPNMKAIDRLNDVEAGLTDAAREAEDAQKETRFAKETYQDLKKRR